MREPFDCKRSPFTLPRPVMTAALTKALETYDPDWLAAGLEGSYLRTVGGVMYVVLVGRRGDVLAVYRVSRKRLHVSRAERWPRALAEELLSNLTRSSAASNNMEA